MLIGTLSMSGITTKLHSRLFLAAAIVVIIIVVLLFPSLSINYLYYYHYYYHYHPFSFAFAAYAPARVFPGGPVVLNNNSHLKVEAVFKGLRSPSSMAFLGPNDILVLEKVQGTVQRIVNGTKLPHPLLRVPVATLSERGMLGIAISNNGPHTYVFLYYTESGGGKQSDDAKAGVQPLGNRLYRYELVNNQLINPKLLLDLPAIPPNATSIETNHNGGKVRIGPDNNVYLVIGDVGGHRGQTQNVRNGPPPDGTGGILRVTQDGQPLDDGILGNRFPLNLYYAYGIRNSFGMDFDPVTGKLWDTENGPTFGDEINLVEPGFNSGWIKVQGIWQRNGELAAPVMSEDLLDHDHDNNNSAMVTFGGKGKYRAPEFSWYFTVAPTDLKFLNSDKLGKQYQNDMFVGDIVHGNLYHFKLNSQRTGLLLPSSLANKIAQDPIAAQAVVFADGFGGVTDIQVGPDDGYLYILSYTDGTIYRIVPVS